MLKRVTILFVIALAMIMATACSSKSTPAPAPTKAPAAQEAPADASAAVSAALHAAQVAGEITLFDQVPQGTLGEGIAIGIGQELGLQQSIVQPVRHHHIAHPEGGMQHLGKGTQVRHLLMLVQPL